MAIVIEDGIIPERLDVRELDNRDPNETWLWIGNDYCSVSPYELIENMAENCTDWIVEEEGITLRELEQALAILKRASGIK